MWYMLASGRLEKVGIVSPGTLRASLLIYKTLETFDGPLPPDGTPNFIPKPTQDALPVFRGGRKVTTRGEDTLPRV
jgi:hypothetical protein